MTINAYTGKPRNGKSYGVTENVILPSLLAGRHVYTNIPMNIEALTERLKDSGINECNLHVLDIKDCEDDTTLASIPGGAVIVLDELWRLWPSGMKANAAKQSHKSFLAEHGHRVGLDGRTQEIVFVTQDLAQIAAFARLLVEQTFVVTKLSAVGSETRFRLDIWQGAVTGTRPPGKPIRSLFGKFKPEIYNLYKSHTMSETGLPGMEERVDKRGSALKSGMIKYGIPFGIVFIIYGAYLVVDMLSNIGTNKEDEIITVEQRIKEYPPQEKQRRVIETINGKPVSGVTTVRTAGSLPVSSDWRLAAYIQSHDLNKASRAILVGRFRTREVPPQDCKPYTGTREIHCVVDGELVTPWSGPETVPTPGVALSDKDPDTIL